MRNKGLLSLLMVPLLVLPGCGGDAAEKSGGATPSAAEEPSRMGDTAGQGRRLRLGAREAVGVRPVRTARRASIYNEPRVLEVASAEVNPSEEVLEKIRQNKLRQQEEREQLQAQEVRDGFAIVGPILGDDPEGDPAIADTFDVVPLRGGHAAGFGGAPALVVSEIQPVSDPQVTEDGGTSAPAVAETPAPVVTTQPTVVAADPTEPIDKKWTRRY